MPSSCPPSCAIPSCPQPGCSPCSTCSYPVGGLGKLSCCPDSCCSPCGNTTSASCLGHTSGASVSCLNQLPPMELTIKPAPVNVIIPGAVMCASGEPVRVGGRTACGGCPPCGRICDSPC